MKFYIHEHTRSIKIKGRKSDFISCMRNCSPISTALPVLGALLGRNCIRARDTRVSNFPWHHRRARRSRSEKKLAHDTGRTLTRRNND